MYNPGMISAVPKTLLVILVRNHRETLRPVVESAIGAGLPVLVVDDGSRDGGLDSVADMPIARHRLPESRGTGAAILSGATLAEKSGYDAILTIEADGRHDPADARRLIETAAQSWPAVVIGVRRNDGTNTPPPLFRRSASEILMRLECGKMLPDGHSSFRLYPIQLLVARRFLSLRRPFEMEAPVRAAWARVPLLFAPVSVRDAPAAEPLSRIARFSEGLRLAALHAALLTRSLLPWPHRRLAAREAEDSLLADILHPIRFFRRLSLEHSGAGELAAAVWVGIFVGSLPIIPFGIAAIVYVNHRLHLNKLAGVAASNVCCFPVVPFLCVEAGHFLLHGRFLSLLSRQALIDEMHLRLWEWLLGALVIGPILGLAGALLTCLAVRSLRARQQEALPAADSVQP